MYMLGILERINLYMCLFVLSFMDMLLYCYIIMLFFDFCNYK